MSVERQIDPSLVWNSLSKPEQDVCLDFSKEGLIGLGNNYFTLVKGSREIVNSLIKSKVMEENDGRTYALEWITKNKDNVDRILKRGIAKTDEEHELLSRYRMAVGIVATAKYQSRYRLTETFQDFVANNSSASPDIE